jgi:hypothetical protein
LREHKFQRKPGGGRKPKEALTVIEAIVCRRPRIGSRAKQHLCADADFRGASAAQSIRRRRYVPHVRSRRDDQLLARSCTI